MAPHITHIHTQNTRTLSLYHTHTHTHTRTHTRQVVQAVKDSQGQTMTFVIQRAGAEPDDLEVVKQ